MRVSFGQMLWTQAELWRGGTVGGDSPRGQIQSRDVAVWGQGELTVLRLESIDMNGSIRRLRCHVFIQRIPRHSLHVVIVLGDLSHDLTCVYISIGQSNTPRRRHTSLGIVDPGDVVQTAGDEEDPIGRPGQVVDLRTRRAAHELDPPCFSILGSFLP